MLLSQVCAFVNGTGCTRGLLRLLVQLEREPVVCAGGGAGRVRAKRVHLDQIVRNKSMVTVCSIEVDDGTRHSRPAAPCCRSRRWPAHRLPLPPRFIPISNVASSRKRADSHKTRRDITPPAWWAEKEGGAHLPFFCSDVPVL
ncbi:hypothetical protein BC827DRAFT_1227318 [Russula dissimulans]|nr:hypothetical protein BC827DRAFT_1227318 [Russula dissimulans]